MGASTSTARAFTAGSAPAAEPVSDPGSGWAQEGCDVPEVTLWELIWAVSEVADDEREVVATVAHMLTSGSVRVVGSPRNRSIRFA